MSERETVEAIGKLKEEIGCGTLLIVGVLWLLLFATCSGLDSIEDAIRDAAASDSARAAPTNSIGSEP